MITKNSMVQNLSDLYPEDLNLENYPITDSTEYQGLSQLIIINEKNGVTQIPITDEVLYNINKYIAKGALDSIEELSTTNIRLFDSTQMPVLAVVHPGEDMLNKQAIDDAENPHFIQVMISKENPMYMDLCYYTAVEYNANPV
jgi:hypothetical protein